MAVTISHYNHTRKILAEDGVAINLANLKVMLRDANTVFNAAHTVLADLAGAEVSGSGWTAGGEAIANAAITTVNTNEAKLDGDDISVTATGGAIGPTPVGVIYDDSATKRLLFFVDFGEAKTADEGTPFQITWHANGIHLWKAPA